MGDRVACQAAYQKAADIADVLLRDGVPLVAYGDLDMGAKVGFVFQLDGERAKYACRVPLELATVDHVRGLYEAVK